MRPDLHLPYFVRRIFPSRNRPLSDRDCDLDFLVMGTQKGGTTSLHAILRQHPQLLLPMLKELHFFDQDRNFWLFPRYLLYHSHFYAEYEFRLTHNSALLQPFPSIVKGEITPVYMYWQAARDRIHSYNPEIKMIFLLRNPVMRAASHHAMEYSRKNEPLPFSDAIRTEPARLLATRTGQHKIYSYVSRGFYGSQIEHLLERFPRHNMLFIKTDDFASDFKRQIFEIQRFLGVDCIELQAEYLHIGDTKTPSPKDQEHLLDIYASDIDKLEKLTGLDCTSWKKIPVQS